MKLVSIGLLAAITVLYAPTTTAHPSGRILDGEEADKFMFPYAASLRLDHAHICGGSIIDEYHILTAAHCVAEDNGEPHNIFSLSVRFGTTNQFAGGKIISVHEIHIHPGYNGYENNIAIVRLSKELQWENSNRIQAIELASSNADNPSTGTNVTVAGWGRLDSDLLSYKLRHDSFAVANETVCSDVFPTKDASVICLTHELKKGSCKGDAGNGAVYKNKIVGVFNYVVGACGSRYPDVYIKVSLYASWIQGVINEFV